MEEQLATGNIRQAIEAATTIRENEEKINFHGKKADGIVKNMIQHSRTGSALKEATDLNALADEYFRLAYHGMRAKDKTFNAELQTHFDPSVGKVTIIPQDIARALLNLYNNAFYAVNEKLKTSVAGFAPVVTVSTEKLNDKIKLTVKDNGNGIPEKIRDKIFQPFFTTKPTGQGTGLGLSLAYDIVIRGHHGELGLKTADGEGSEFTIQLPLV
jgi:signal transduction histidine kinase